MKTIGYISGTFDLFHIGHVNILKKSKSLCDYLIVGVTSDKLVSYKSKKAVIPFKERVEIISSCKYVDMAIPQNAIDKFKAWQKLNFDIMFVGDDWHSSAKWEKYEEQLNNVGVKIIYFPYTKSTSSTLINSTLKKLRSK